MEMCLVGRGVVAFVLGLILIFQISSSTTIASNNGTPFSWALSSEPTRDPPVAQEVDVLLTMKQTKKLTLLSIKNNSESPVYSVEVKSPNGAIKFVKAKRWVGEQLDLSTLKVSTSDTPISQKGNLILLILTTNFSASLQWSVSDGIGKVLASGTVNERAGQSGNKSITQEGIVGVAESQSAADDNTLILKVVDRSSKRPVEGAVVIIINSSGKVLAGKTTDSNGEIRLIVSLGNYKVTIQADNYNKLVESLEVHGNTQKAFELTRTSSVTIRTTSTIN